MPHATSCPSCGLGFIGTRALYEKAQHYLWRCPGTEQAREALGL